MFEMGSATSSSRAVETVCIRSSGAPASGDPGAVGSGSGGSPPREHGASASRPRAWWALVAMACLALSAPAIALAGPPSDPTSAKAAPTSSASAAVRAKEHFDAAQALFDKKKYDAALVLFREAYDETKSPNAHLMVGVTLLKLGRLAEAYDELVATMREAGARAETEPKYASARDQAAAEIAPLEAKVAKLVLTFTGAGAPPGARVSVNGAAVPADKLGAPMAMMPGDVQIVVEGLGPAPLKRTETLVAGSAKTVVLGPPAPEKSASPKGTQAPIASASPVPSATATAGDSKSGGSIRTAGYGVAAVGAVGMVLFGVGAGVAQSKADQLQKECGGVRCTDPKYADVVDAGKTMDLMAAVGLGAGILGLAGGAAMILFGGPTAKPSKPVPTATIDVGPSGAAIRVKGSF